MHALDWLKECGHILRGAIQPIKYIPFASCDHYRYRCSVTQPLRTLRKADRVLDSLWQYGDCSRSLAQHT